MFDPFDDFGFKRIFDPYKMRVSLEELKDNSIVDVQIDVYSKYYNQLILERKEQQDIDRKIKIRNFYFSRVTAIIYFIFVAFIFSRCLNLVFNQNIPTDIQKLALSTGASLLTGTIGFVVGQKVK